MVKNIYISEAKSGDKCQAESIIGAHITHKGLISLILSH